MGIDFWEAIGFVPDLRNDQWHFAKPDIAVVKTDKDTPLQSTFDLSIEQRNELENLIEQHFESNNSELSRTDLVQHVIKINSPPHQTQILPSESKSTGIYCCRIKQYVKVRCSETK